MGGHACACLRCEDSSKDSSTGGIRRGGRRAEEGADAAAEAVDIHVERDAPGREPLGRRLGRSLERGEVRSPEVDHGRAPRRAAGAVDGQRQLGRVRDDLRLRDGEHGEQIVARRVGLREGRAELAVEAQRRVEECGRGRAAVLGQQVELGRPHRSPRASRRDRRAAAARPTAPSPFAAPRSGRVRCSPRRRATRSRPAGPTRPSRPAPRCRGRTRDGSCRTRPMLVSGPRVTIVNSPGRSRTSRGAERARVRRRPRAGPRGRRRCRARRRRG